MHRRSLATPLIVTVLVTIATVVTFTTASSPSESATATAPGVPGKAAPSGAYPDAADERQGRTTVVLTHRDADGRQRTCVLRWREQAQRHGDVRGADGERSTPRGRAAFARALERAVADCERPGATGRR